MDLGAISTGILSLSETFTPWLVLAVFIITMAAQFGLFVPYLLESIWLFSGYNAIIGNYSPLFLVALCIVGIIGREVGSGAFFLASSWGSLPLQRFYRHRIEPRLLAGRDGQSGPGPLKRLLARVLGLVFTSPEADLNVQLFGRPLHCSPFMVALGHFLWLRVPITMALGLKGKMKPLLLGVAIFSVVFDGIYILIGVLGAAEGLSRGMMFVYSIGVMALIFFASYGVRRLARQPSTR